LLANATFPTAKVLGQCLALAVFHYEEIRVSIAADIEEGADVGMAERRNCARLALKALPQVCPARGIGPEDLERNDTVQPSVASLIDFTHAAGTELFDNLIVTQCLADHAQSTLQQDRPPNCLKAELLVL
jgi:hypothetical protein